MWHGSEITCPKRFVMDGRHCTAARDEGRTSERARETEEGSGKREQRRRRLRESRREGESKREGGEGPRFIPLFGMEKKLRLNFARTLLNTSRGREELHEIVGVDSPRDVGAKKI